MENIGFKDIFSFDGKVDKSSARKKGFVVDDVKPLNVYSDKLQMCIDQEMIKEKANKNHKEILFKDIKWSEKTSK